MLKSCGYMHTPISNSYIPIILFVSTFLFYLFGFYIFGQWAASAGESIPVIAYSDEYAVLAKNLTHKVFSLSAQPPYIPDTFRTPGYPGFLWIVFILRDWQWVVIAQILLASATVALTYLIGKRISQRTGVGILAAFILLGSTANFVYTLNFDAETLLTFLLVLVVYIYVRTEESENKILLYASVGFLVGIGILVKPVMVFVPALFVLFALMYLKRSKLYLPAITMCITASLVVGPWLVRNAQVAHVWGISSVSAYNFYQFYIPSFIAYKNALPLDVARAAFEHQHPDIPHNTQDIFYAPQMRAAVKEVLLENPVAYPIYHLSFLKDFFERSGYPDLLVAFQSIHTSKPLPTSAYTVGITIFEEFWAMVFLYMAIISCFFMKSAKRGWYLILWSLILYFAIAAGPVSQFASARLRMPITPLLAVLTAVGIYGIVYMFVEWARTGSLQVPIFASFLKKYSD
jgi:4-amino-4-deoxy-L-arabinose transferase-like glycosyltransferase